MADFFRRWQNDLQPTPRSDFEDDAAVGEVYDLFCAFYEESNMDAVRSDFYSDYHRGIDYIVFGTNIMYTVAPEGVGLDELMAVYNPEIYFDLKYTNVPDFRLDPEIEGKTALYMTEDYDKALNRFLGYGGYDASFYLAEDEMEKREKFIDTYLSKFHAHWVAYWNFTAVPRIWKVLLTHDFAEAFLYYQIIYGGYHGYLKKEENRWIITGQRLATME